MKYNLEFDGKSCICTREQIENGDYDIVSSKTAKKQILIVFNDLIFYRANDLQNYRKPEDNISHKWAGFNINISCIQEEEELF